MKKTNMKKIISLLLAVLLVFTVGSISVLAGNGDGTGGGDKNSPLNLQSVMYLNGSNYTSLSNASVSGTFSGYIRFDRGMTTYSADNFEVIVLANNSGDEYELNLQEATSNITEGGTNYDKKYIYTFSVSNLPNGSYTLTLGSAITANNGHTLENAPIYIPFSVS